VIDISLAKNLLGYKAETSLSDGLKETWNWFINNQDEYLMKKNYFTEK
jgi:nucleoside-diphosphate-sugar epimerase